MAQDVSSSLGLSVEVVTSTATMLVEVARSLVDEPHRVTVKAVESGDSTLFILRVGLPDLGKVIGRQGRTARSLRTVVNAIAVKTKNRFNLDIEPDTALIN